jgi:signal transduction histidine kinase
MLRLPPPTVRLRLTLLYGTLFLTSGALLLATTYLLVRNSTANVFLTPPPHASHSAIKSGGGPVYRDSPVPSRMPLAAAQVRAAASRQRAVELHQLLIQSLVSLAIMAVISVALGWVIAGRVLRPLRTMTSAARRISERNLHERLAIEGPRDELRDLADTVDGLLARLESAFVTQRRFVANAAHELRTPLTLLRALLEENLTDPNATLESFRDASRRLLAIGDEHERLLEALLTLAASERGLDQREPFDLSVITDEVLLSPRPDANRLGLDVTAKISPAPTIGDPTLAKRLVANLIDNAVRYNVAGGSIQVATGVETRRAWLSVTNTGSIIPPDQLERLFEPFQRASTDRTAHDHAHGLGLSIVRAIAAAHDATITAQPEPQGGLLVLVSFPYVRDFDAPGPPLAQKPRISLRAAGAPQSARETHRAAIHSPRAADQPGPSLPNPCETLTIEES